MVFQNQVVERVYSSSASNTKAHVSSSREQFFTTKNSDYQPKLTKEIFEALLQNTFKILKKETHRNYIKNKWLSVYFEEFLLQKTNLGLYNQLFGMLKSFYSLHPFALDKKLVEVFFEFFQKYPSLIEFVKGSEININEGLDTLIQNHFIPEFLKIIQDKIVSNSNYKSIKHILVKTLHLAIERKLQSFDPDYIVKNNKKLWDWVNAFNYETSKKLKINDLLYDNHFISKSKGNTWLQLQESAYKIIVNELFVRMLNTTPPSSLLQVVYHYIFLDFFASKKLTTIKEETLENAQLLILNSQKNNQKSASNSIFKQKLELFLPGLSALVQKFNLYYKTTSIASGLEFSRIQGTEYLTQTDDTEMNYDFSFQFQFVTPFLNATRQANNIQFTIPVKDFISPLQQAINIVEKFKKTIVWNLGYKNSPKWTEKDIVQWIDDFSDFKSFINFIKEIDGKNRHSLIKSLSLNEWSRFSATSLANLDFSSVVSNSDKKYEFVIRPIIKFVKPQVDKGSSLSIFINKFLNREPLEEKFYENGIFVPEWNSFGSIQIYLRLTQYAINSEGLKTLEGKPHLFDVRDLTEIVPIANLFSNLIKKQFPKLVTYNDVLAKNNQIWLNEFLNSEKSPVASSNLKGLDEWKKRTNFQEILTFASQLVADVNSEYRNSFSIEDANYLHHWASLVLGINTFGFKILDNANMWGELALKHTISIRDLEAFENVKFKSLLNKKSIYDDFANKLWGARVISTDHKNFEDEEDVPMDTVFKVGEEEMTLAEIHQRLQSYDLKFNATSKIGSIIGGEKRGATGGNNVFSFRYDKSLHQRFQKIYDFRRYIQLYYSIDYYDFVENEQKTKSLKFTVPLELYHVWTKITPEEMQDYYNQLINNLNDLLKSNKKLKFNIEKIMDKARENGKWKNNFLKWKFMDLIREAEWLVENYDVNSENNNPNDIKDEEISDVSKKINDIFDGKAPTSVLEKLKDKEYSDVFKKILENRGKFSKENMQKIFNNANLINLLKNQKEFDLSKTLNQYAKISNSTKYAYLGSGIGFGIVGLLSGLTSLRQIRLYIKTKQAQTKFKKTRTISIFSLFVSILTIATSAVLTLLFFIEKGGF